MTNTARSQRPEIMGWLEPAGEETDVMGGAARVCTEVMGRPQPAGERTDVLGGPGRPTDVMSGRVPGSEAPAAVASRHRRDVLRPSAR